MPVAALLSAAYSPERFLNCASHDELTAEDMHRRSHRLAHHGFAGTSNKVAQSGAQIVGRSSGAQKAAGQHQCPGRRVDEYRLRTPEMALPVRFADFVADQPVDSLRIRDAQQ